CEACHKAEGVIQCTSCVGLHAWCKSCAVNVHQHLPFHQLEICWSGAYYLDISLCQLGLLEY
ncbi:hypothetical protein PAXRUDRAFT_86804, partial [Paxillus rubicundulus Ve08.2h10]